MTFYIENRVGVSASPEVIWGVLADIEAWPSWAPMYRRVSGALRIGATLTLEVALPGEAPETLAATVLDWAPELQIHFKVKLYGGLISSTRYLEIEKLSERGCIFSNGEMVRGPLAGFIPRRLKAAMRQAFIEMGEGLKAKAEAAAQTKA